MENAASKNVVRPSSSLSIYHSRMANTTKLKIHTYIHTHTQTPNPEEEEKPSNNIYRGTLINDRMNRVFDTISNNIIVCVCLIGPDLKYPNVRREMAKGRAK